MADFIMRPCHILRAPIGAVVFSDGGGNKTKVGHVDVQLYTSLM